MPGRTTLGFAKSDALYKRALETIPLASQTFSKSAMNLVRGASPLFLDRGDGCFAWDVDGNRYIDYVAGLLPIVLGYRNPDVDAAILAQLQKGITLSLATELEIELAELLVRLVPCAEMVRFGKNGSDATSAAIRLARAHTGRGRVAVCGYHGWHDWYIGTTARHLGVPQAVRDLSTTFPFNDLNALEGLLRADPDGFAAVILEPAGAVDPAPGFLAGVRDLCTKYGVVLVFDEIVSGFRIHIGGAQAHYGVTPDLSSFGKAMGNGMPISAVVGRREVMRRMDDIFFSGTFGGEALSLAASIATIRTLERTNGIARMHAYGRRLKEAVNKEIAARDLSRRIAFRGPDWKPIVAVDDPADIRPVTTSLLRQEFIANGILLGGVVGLCLAHDDESVFQATIGGMSRTLDAVAEALALPDPKVRLRGEIVRPVFQVRG